MGSQHAERWAEAHAGDLVDEHATAPPGTFLDAVSAVTAGGAASSVRPRPSWGASWTTTRDLLAGVASADPDGRPADCYNSEVATIHLSVLDRVTRPRPGPIRRQTLIGDHRADFEDAQREPVPGPALPS